MGIGRIAAIVAAGAVVLGGAGCDEAAEKAAEKVAENQGLDDVDIDLDNGEITVADEDGSFSTGPDLPANFPAEVPLPEGGTIVGSAGGTSSSGGGWQIIYSGLDATDLSAYRDTLTGAGYQIQNTASEGDSGSFAATGNGYSILVGASNNGFSVTVTTA